MANDTSRDDVPLHEIIISTTQEERQQCFDVRVEVFHHEQKFPLELEYDEKEEISTHFLLRLTPSQKPIGTIRGYLIPGTTDSYKLTRLAVLKEYRKYGFGRKLVSALHAWAETHHASTRLASSPTTIIPGPDGDGGGVSTADPSSKSHPIIIKIIANSQIYAKGFYAKLGYAPEGDEFIEDGEPHQQMVLRVSIPPSP